MVDDASTDDTPDVIKAKAVQYPGQVVHLRRDKGGEGKSHTLNHGLRIILADDWMQALLIMEQRKITSLFITDAENRVEGIIHLHDLWGLELF